MQASHDHTTATAAAAAAVTSLGGVAPETPDRRWCPYKIWTFQKYFCQAIILLTWACPFYAQDFFFSTFFFNADRMLSTCHALLAKLYYYFDILILNFASSSTSNCAHTYSADMSIEGEKMNNNTKFIIIFKNCKNLAWGWVCTHNRQRQDVVCT